MPGSNPNGAVRALVIGAGPAAVQMHLPVLARLRDRGELVLSLVCDLQQDRAATARRMYGFDAECADAVAAIESNDIDAVYVFGSAQMHHQYGLEALHCGKHLFVEKPLAPSYRQARELANLARERGLTAVGGHNRRFYGALNEARARAGVAGWRLAEAIFHKPETGKPAPYGARTWLGANGIHALDALVYMMGGLPEHVAAEATALGSERPSQFCALMRWRGGARGVFLCNNDAGSRREEYVFHAPGETYTIDATGLTVEKDGVATPIPVPRAVESVTAEHESFLSAIRADKTAPAHSIDALAPSVFLAELIEAGFTGLVKLPDCEPRRAAVPRTRIVHSILVSQAAGLEAALARHLSGYRLICLEDIRRSMEPRPDVLAAILGSGSEAIPEELLVKLPRLSIVGVVGLSLARHEPEALLARGIDIVNASGSYADSVAEFALALAILGRRRALASHELMRRGGWGSDLRLAGLKGAVYGAARRVRPAVRAAGLERLLLRLWRAAANTAGAGAARRVGPRDLQGASVGLLGWGANARAFAIRLIGAKARVMVHSDHAPESEIIGAGAIPVSLDEALAADIVSLHRGLTGRTRHFLGAAELSRLRPGAVLINVARGALIDPGALLARLRRGDIFACLDTYEQEPPARYDPLRYLPNVFLTSHIAGGSSDMRAAAADEVAQKIAGRLSGQIIACVSAARLETMT